MSTFHYQESITAFIGAFLEESKRFSFETLIEETENAYGTAQGLMDLKSGFNDKGRVEDLAKAQKTTNAIELYLSSTWGNKVEEVHVVFEAVQAYQTASEIYVCLRKRY